MINHNHILDRAEMLVAEMDLFEAKMNLLEAKDYATYEDYCISRTIVGLQVIPEELYKALKG